MDLGKETKVVAQINHSEEEIDLEKWKKDIQSKVTALKCHLLATKGLTLHGEIGDVYSPKKLLEEEINFNKLNEEEKKEILLYVETAMTKIIVNNKVVENENEALALSANDVQFALDFDKNTEENNEHNDVPDGSHKLENESCDKIANEILKTSIDMKGSFLDQEEEFKETENIKKTLSKQTKEIEKLSKIRDEVENELQDLTANLFQVSNIFRLQSIVHYLTYIYIKNSY